MTVSATNAVGTSPDSAAVTVVLDPMADAKKPDAPSGVTAVRGNGQATVSWVKPAANGSPITGFTITASPGGVVKAVGPDATSATVEGLVNGTPHTFTVTATNSVGTSDASVPSEPVTPAGAPSRPAAPTAVRGDGQATVSWAAAADNGAAVTGYTVSASPGSKSCTTTSALSCVVDGLSNGTGYTFTVTATNSVGTSADSPGSNSVTPVAAATKPNAPTGVTAVRGNGQATVSWVKPAANGSPITGFTITASPGGVVKTVGPEATSATVEGLVNGTAYTFTVTATNGVGTSAASLPSASVTPVGPIANPYVPSVAVPSKASKPTVKAGKRKVTVTWKAPASNGAPILSYRVRSSAGKTMTVRGSSRKVTFKKLKKGRVLTFKVTAINRVGAGATSGSSKKVKVK